MSNRWLSTVPDAQLALQVLSELGTATAGVWFRDPRLSDIAEGRKVAIIRALHIQGYTQKTTVRRVTHRGVENQWRVKRWYR